MAQAPPQPAAAGGGAANPPPLPVPALTPALFATLYADANLDPTGGDPGRLQNPFLHDLANPNNNTGTPVLQNGLAQSGAERQLIAATIISGQRARVYNCAFRWEDGLTNNNPDLANHYYALEGELIGNNGYVVELPGNVFHLLTNQVYVPTVATIQAAYAADANATQFGPYTPQDQGTEIVKTRKIVPIPHFVVGFWLSQPDGIDAPTFWRTVYPTIVTAGKVNECKALLQYFQVAVTIPPNGAAGDPSLLDVTRPAPPPRNAALLLRVQEILEHHFVQLRRDAASQQTNQIATAVGALAHQNRLQYEEAKREKDQARQTTVEKMFGKDNFRRLLTMVRVPNEIQLEVEVPFYKKLAEVPKAQRLGVLNTAVQKTMDDNGHTHLTFPTSAGLLSSLMTLQWHRVHDDSLTSGLLGNPFLFGDSDEEQQQAINLQVNMMESGGAAMSKADAAALLALDINPPLEDKSVDNVRRMDVLCQVLLPAAHPFRIYVRKHLDELVSYMPKWEQMEMSHPALQPAKGVMHLQYLALRVSRYWKEQSVSLLPVTLPDPKELFTDISYSRPWEPSMSSSLRSKLRLATVGQGGGGSIPGLTDSSDQSSMSGITQATLEAFMRQFGGSGGGGTGGSGTGGGGGREGTNRQFNEVLFGEYRNRRVDGKPVRARDLRQKVTDGELPEFPTSIYCSTPMCPAWHIKGMCNSSCPRHEDHKDYSVEQYAPMVGWCQANYPS